MSKSEKHKEQINVELEGNSVKSKKLILFNDEVNSFDFVVTSLIEVCDHSEEQALQCTLIAHYNGSCDVKKGSFNYLKSLRNEMIKRNLKASIC